MLLLVVVVEEGSICALCGRGVYLFGGALSRLTVWCIGVFSGLRMYTFVRVLGACRRRRGRRCSCSTRCLLTS